jgi:hypothetical protein
VIVPRSPYEPVTGEMWDALRNAWPNGARLTVAFRLARDVDTCARLLAGEPVERGSLDPDGLAWARERRFVTIAPLIYVPDEEPVAA